MPKHQKKSSGLDVSNSSVVFLHQTTTQNPIKKVKKKAKPGSSASRKESEWFFKTEPDLDAAVREVVANEFFRLIIPTQPKTRLVYDELSKQYRLMSKEAQDFKNLNAKWNVCSGILSGLYKNAGLISVISLFLNEVDLKWNGNLGIDENNNFIKLDGGWSFARLRDNWPGSDFTSQDIDKLPYLTHYRPYNWIDVIDEGVNQATSRYVHASVVNNHYYRQEVNLGMLRMLLIPDDYLRAFVDAYVSCDSVTELPFSQNLIAEMLSRKQLLKKAALESKSFKTFMQTDAAKTDATDFLTNLAAFKTYEKNKVHVSDLATKCAREFLEIRKLSQPVTDSFLDKPLRVSNGFFNRHSKGLIGGGLLGALSFMTTILLQVSVVPAFGLSLPVLILISVLLGGLVGAGLGAGAQCGFAKLSCKRLPADESKPSSLSIRFCVKEESIDDAIISDFQAAFNKATETLQRPSSLVGSVDYCPPSRALSAKSMDPADKTREVKGGMTRQQILEYKRESEMEMTYSDDDSEDLGYNP